MPTILRNICPVCMESTCVCNDHATFFVGSINRLENMSCGPCGNEIGFTIETLNSGFTGPTGFTGITGFTGFASVHLGLCDTLRFVTEGTMFLNVTRGSALVQIDAENLIGGTGPPSLPPPAPDFIFLYHNRTDDSAYLWNTETRQWNLSAHGTGPITSSSITVTGTVTAGNGFITPGDIVAGGQIVAGGNITSGGSITATSNLNVGGNIIGSGMLSVTGNIVTPNNIGAGPISSSSNISAVGTMTAATFVSTGTTTQNTFAADVTLTDAGPSATRGTVTTRNVQTSGTNNVVFGKYNSLVIVTTTPYNLTPAEVTATRIVVTGVGTSLVFPAVATLIAYVQTQTIIVDNLTFTDFTINTSLAGTVTSLVFPAGYNLYPAGISSIMLLTPDVSHLRFVFQATLGVVDVFLM